MICVPMHLVPATIGFVTSLAITALFSYLETAVTAVRFFRIRELVESAGRHKKLLAIIEHAPHRILVTMLIASSLANVTAAALITIVMQNMFSEMGWSQGLGLSVGIALATAAILIFGEIIPKNFAKAHGEKHLGSFLWLISLSYYLLYPCVKILTHMSDFVIRRVMRIPDASPSEQVTSEKEIKFLIEYIDQKGLMEREKSVMLQNIFRIGNTHIRNILVPEPDMVIIDESLDVQQAFQIFVQHQFSRLPAYRGQQDNIVGLLHQKDIFAPLQQQQYTMPIKDLIRPILFVPESVHVNQLLKEFKLSGTHMAIVLDEHGGVAGLVTLEDVLEEIVGEIRDEYEEQQEKIVPLSGGGWLASGNIPLQDLGAFLAISFETETAITLAGFLAEKLQHMPKKEDQFVYKNLRFIVQKATVRRVLQVKVIPELGRNTKKELA